MIIERSAGPKRVEIGGDDMDTPLEAILPVEPIAEQVCLLRDSPFRILRVSLHISTGLQFVKMIKRCPTISSHRKMQITDSFSSFSSHFRAHFSGKFNIFSKSKASTKLTIMFILINPLKITQNPLHDTIITTHATQQVFLPQRQQQVQHSTRTLGFLQTN